MASTNSLTHFTWDGVVRTTHWLVALGCLCNLFVLRPGSVAHQAIGYSIAVLVLLRLLWALTVARAPARLRDLIPTPQGFRTHLADLRLREHRELGHNAFGLLFIWAAWLLLFALAGTGYLAALSSETGGIVPALSTGIEDFAYDFQWFGQNIEDWHGIFATVLQVLVCVHVVAVFATGKWLRHNYLRAMIHRPKEKK